MSAVNTGRVVYGNLQQIFTDSGEPTGTTKTNSPNDPDYIPPFVDDTSCPPPIPPTPNINQVQIIFKNLTTQGITLSNLQVGPLSNQDPSAAYYKNAAFSILPNAVFDAPLEDQIDDSAYIAFTPSLAKKIRTKIAIMYQRSTESSPTDVDNIDIIDAQFESEHFLVVRVSGTSDTNTLTFIFTEDPLPPPTPPNPPVVTAGANQSIQLPTTNAMLNGTLSSSDPTTTVQWIQVSGPGTAVISSPSSVQTQVSGLVQGTYVFQIKALDSFGQSNTAQTTVVVNPAAVNPNGVMNIYVDASMPDASYQITQITLFDLVNTSAAPITVLTVALDKTSGVTIKNPLKGTYRMVVQIAGSTANVRSLTVQWAAGSNIVSFNLPQAGGYTIDGVVVNEGVNGVLINFSASTVTSPTLTMMFAHMITSSPTQSNQNQLPNDLIVQENGNVTVNFFSDAGGTTPSAFTGNVYYDVAQTDNLTTNVTTSTSKKSVAAQTSIVVETLQRYQHYDYSQTTPLVQDNSYAYTLDLGQGYLII